MEQKQYFIKFTTNEDLFCYAIVFLEGTNIYKCLTKSLALAKSAC